MDELGQSSYFLCGAFGGLCTIIAGHPFDTVKVRLQTIALRAEENIVYKGALDCARQTFQSEGYRGFYKGVKAPLLGVAPVLGISYVGYEFGKKVFFTDDRSKLSNLQHFTAGAFTGAVASVIITPGERIKCLLQIQGDALPKPYKGVYDCVKKLWLDGGIRSLYRGTCVTFLREVPAAGLYFLTYEKLKEVFTKRGTKNAGAFKTILAGGIAGMVSWCYGMPLDVLKSRIQTAPDGLYENGIRDAVAHLMETEGAIALYKGMSPVFLRAIPASAACYFGADLCKIFLEDVNSYFRTSLYES